MNKIILLLSGQHQLVLKADYTDKELWAVLDSPTKYVKLRAKNENDEEVFTRVDPSTVQATVIMPWIEQGKVARPAMMLTPRGRVN